MQAVRIMQKRKYTAVQCQDLVGELQAYKSSSPPFNAPLGNLSTFQPKLWWQGIDARLTIVHLAIFLYDMVPHAATVERGLDWKLDCHQDILRAEATPVRFMRKKCRYIHCLAGPPVCLSKCSCKVWLAGMGYKPARCRPLLRMSSA